MRCFNITYCFCGNIYHRDGSNMPATHTGLTPNLSHEMPDFWVKFHSYRAPKNSHPGSLIDKSGHCEIRFNNWFLRFNKNRGQKVLGEFSNHLFQSWNYNIVDIGKGFQHLHFKLQSLTGCDIWYTTYTTSPNEFCLAHKVLGHEGCRSSCRFQWHEKKSEMVQTFWLTYEKKVWQAWDSFEGPKKKTSGMSSQRLKQ